MAMDIQATVRGTLAGKMALALDLKDGQDRKISRSVWNDFVDKIGTGKKIEEGVLYISLEDAIRCITKYCVKAGARSGKTGTEQAKQWKNDNPEFFDTPPVVAKKMPPKNIKMPTGYGYTKKFPAFMDGIKKIPGIGKVELHNGYIHRVFDKEERTARSIEHNEDGSIAEIVDWKYSDNKEYIITYNGNGSLDWFGVSEYSDDGTFGVSYCYNPEGFLQGWGY